MLVLPPSLRARTRLGPTDLSSLGTRPSPGETPEKLGVISWVISSDFCQARDRLILSECTDRKKRTTLGVMPALPLLDPKSQRRA